MPVVGTPVPTPSALLPTTVIPDVTQLYGVLLPSKRRTLYARQGLSGNLVITFYDRNGTPQDVVPYSTFPLTLKASEVINLAGGVGFTVTGSYTDPSVGVVSFTTPAGLTAKCGVYVAEAGITDPATGALVLSNVFYLWVDRGFFGDTGQVTGPPALDSIRVALRDSDPSESRLLGNYEFDVADICHATERCVRHWNESQPPINLFFDTTTFAGQHQWTRGICGILYQTAVGRFMRNHLPYSGAGVSVDDQNKFGVYGEIGKAMWEEFAEWVRMKKTQVNMELAIGTTGSPYGWHGGYW